MSNETKIDGPSAGTPLLELEAFLPYQLNVLAEAVSSSLSKLYAERYGISVPEWRVIATLGQYDTMAARDIGAHSRMHKTKVSRAVSSLEAAGRIARCPNQEDKREVLLTLTGEGRRIYQDLAPLAHSFAEELLAVLPDDDREALDRIISRLRQRSEHLALRFPDMGTAERG